MASGCVQEGFVLPKVMGTAAQSRRSAWTAAAASSPLGRTAPSKNPGQRSATSVPAQNTWPWGRRRASRNGLHSPGAHPGDRPPPTERHGRQSLTTKAAGKKVRACRPQIAARSPSKPPLLLRFVQL